MTDTLPRSMSPTLAGFIDPLAAREAALFGELRSFFRTSRAPQDEQQLRYRLADHAVRVCAAEVLLHESRAAQSQDLRALPTIVDATTARAAAQAVRASNGLEAAALAAQNATIAAADVNDPGFVGEQAAYSVLALADFYVEPGERRRVLDAAVGLLHSLAR